MNKQELLARRKKLMAHWEGGEPLNSQTIIDSDTLLLDALNAIPNNSVVVPRGFLEAAECPDINCDKNGIVAQQISESEWEPMQCQWCHEKEAMLKGVDSNENN